MKIKPPDKRFANIKNFLFAFRLISKASPKIIPCTMLSHFAYVLVNYFIRNIFFLKKMLDIILGGGTYKEFMLWLVFFVVCEIIGNFCDNYGDYFASVEYKVLYEKINEKIFKKASVVDVECFENPEFYSIYKRATEVVSNSKYNTFVWCFSEVICRFAVGIIIIAYVVTVDVKTLIFVIPSLAVFICNAYISKFVFNRDKEMTYNKRVKDYVQRVVFLKDYSKDIRTSGIFNVMKEKLDKAIEDNRRIIKKYGKKTALVNLISAFLSQALPTAGTVTYSAYGFAVTKTIQLADFSVLLTAVNRIKDLIYEVANYAKYLQQSLLYFGNLREFLEFEPKIKDGDRIADDFNSIEFKNVSFSYESGKKTLDCISFKITAGETIAVVGKNGAGKSTFVKLLLRFYEPTEGEILYNGINIKEYNIASYREKIGAVFQNYKVFALTVNENVLCKDVISDSDRLLAENSLKNAGVFEKIETLPNKADSILTREFDKNGISLSGGEQQKVAAARMFAHKFDLAVLDEPSSALDPIAEYKMYESLIDATKNKTVIYISHRLSSAVLADRICVFENGKIVEVGAHRELMEKKGVYEEMFTMQASNYSSLKTNEDSYVENA